MKKFTIVVSLLLAVSLLGGCGWPRAAETGKGVIIIGAVLPLTGASAEFGNQMKQGLDLAGDNINSHRGINGKMVKILYEDSQGDTKTGLSAYKKLRMTDNIQFVFSAISGVTLAILPEAAKDNVLVLTSSTQPEITSGKYLALRIYLTAEQEAVDMADFAFNNLGVRKAGVIYQNSDSLRGYNEKFKERFEELGGNVYSESFDVGSADFRTQLIKLWKEKPEAIYICGWEENGIIAKQARELSIDVQLLGTMTFNSPKTVEVAGSAAEGAIFTIPSFDLTSSKQQMAYFRNSYKQAYGKDPDLTTALFYDGLMMLADGIKEVGVDAQKVLSAVIAMKNYEGATGSISYKGNGDIIMPLEFKVIKDGRFVKYTE